MSDEAAVLIGEVTPQGPLVVICEHASKRVPSPLAPSPQDLAWLDTHWGWDIGAAQVSRELVRRTGSCGVLAGFSRLVCDPNRPESDPTLIREQVEGAAVSFNVDLGPDEVQRRIARYHRPYHQQVDALIRARKAAGSPPLLLSIHSFTPVYAGERRSMEVGVLFDRWEQPARQLADRLADSGLEVALNEPYSGRDGLMYSPHRHGTDNDLVCLEIEVRQDLVGDRAQAHAIAGVLAAALGL